MASQCRGPTQSGVQRKTLFRKVFLSSQKSGSRLNGAVAQVHLCQKGLPNKIETTLSSSDDSGVVRTRRELRVRSDGCRPPQPLTDLRDYGRSPQFQNHWIVVVSGLKFFRETSFALSFSCFLIVGGNTRAATRLLARRLLFQMLSRRCSWWF